MIVEGPSATWTLAANAHAVFDLAPRPETASEPPEPEPEKASPSGPTGWVGVGAHGGGSAAPAAERVDVVAQIERLAALKSAGLLTDEEFTAAKARVLF